VSKRSESPCVKLVLVAVLAACVGAGTRTVARQATPTELEGVWNGETSGRRVFKPGEFVLKFKGNRLFATGLVGPFEKEFSFSLDTKARPRHFDYWDNPATKTECLYEIRGETLRIAHPRLSKSRPALIPDAPPPGVAGSNPRTTPGSETILLILKLAK